jgi:acyl-CoA thioesterase FadM
MNKPIIILALDKFAPTRISIRPKFEGCNINTWIGFKHVCYLLEEALIETWRLAGVLPRVLYEDLALCFEIVESDTRILHALHMDDEVEVEVKRTDFGAGPEATFALAGYITRNGQRLKAVVATMSVILRALPGAVIDTLPVSLKRAVVRRIQRGEERSVAATGLTESSPLLLDARRGREAVEVAVAAGITESDSNALVWRWRIPYFYCYYNERLRYSGYLRIMEEAVDLFLEARGISIKTLLDYKHLIPVVSHASVSMVGEAYMEESLLTVFRVEDIFKGFTYRASMECWVERDGKLILVQKGSITHGYAEIVDRRDWKLVPLDEPTLDAIAGCTV